MSRQIDHSHPECGSVVLFRDVDSSSAAMNPSSGLLILRTYSQNIVASNSPRGSTPPPSMYVAPGECFYFSRAVNNGWADNNRGEIRPLTGYWFEQKNQWLYNGARAQLATLSGGKYFYGYVQEIDWSLGFRGYYANKEDMTWTLNWYMNDSLNSGMYDDNQGTANIDVVVARIV